MEQHIVYGDLNCPYSYALHQSLKNLELLSSVDFRLVEHAPDLGIYGDRPEIATELASDVFAVRSIATKTPLVLPSERPDSRFAILCIIAAKLIDADKANKLRDIFYTALWVNGQDISCPSVIFQCIEEAGLPPDLEVEDECEEQLELWQSQWSKSAVGSRIPATIAPDNRKLLGLVGEQDIQDFFCGKVHNTQNTATKLQRASSLHTIAVLCTNDVTALWAPLAAIKSNFNILLPASMQELKQLFNSEQHSPDLILMHADDDWHELLESYQKFSQRMKLGYTPIAIIGARDDDQLELSAYSAGAADYLIRGRTPGIIKARISMMLDLKKSRDVLERSARIDGLTGVNNRREFEKLLEQEWRRSSRTGQNLALIMLDVDFFKPFNDHYGHLAGDSALRSISKALQQAVNRPDDAVCRYGGEEFAILMPETNNIGAKHVADTLRQIIMDLNIAHKTSKVADIITVSQGISSFTPSDINSPMMLIEAADRALYQAKADGRNAIATHGEY